MNRAFTTREKVLLAILAVLLVACFYWLVLLQPALNALSTVDSRVAALQDEIMIQQVVAANKAQLEQQIAEAEASGAAQKTLPAYDNTKNEIDALDAILAEARTYSINFADADLSGTLARRNVDISFTSDSYDDAHSVLEKLINCQYACLVTDISITGSSLGQSSGGTVSASAAVVFFERME